MGRDGENNRIARFFLNLNKGSVAQLGLGAELYAKAQGWATGSRFG